MTTLLAVSDAHAADPSVARVGWWTRSPSAAAPEGGVVVGAAPDGPESVAAIEVDLDGGAVAAITLAEAGGSLQDAASILVCVTDEPWIPAEGGDLADAPRPDCDRGVAMSRQEGAWHADVGSLLGDRADRATLMLVPSPAPTPLPGVLVPFEVALEPPVLSATSAPTTSPPREAPPASPPASTATTLAALPPPAVVAPTTTVVVAPDPAPSSPTIAALGAEDTRRVWRWGLWLRIVLAGALAGTVAGLARWKLVSRWQTTAP